jgi:hypothetical protein
MMTRTRRRWRLVLACGACGALAVGVSLMLRKETLRNLGATLPSDAGPVRPTPPPTNQRPPDPADAGR